MWLKLDNYLLIAWKNAFCGIVIEREEGIVIIVIESEIFIYILETEKQIHAFLAYFHFFLLEFLLPFSYFMIIGKSSLLIFEEKKELERFSSRVHFPFPSFTQGDFSIVSWICTEM